MSRSDVIAAIYRGSQLTVFIIFLLSVVCSHFFVKSQDLGTRAVRLGIPLRGLSWGILLLQFGLVVAVTTQVIHSRDPDPNLIIENVSGLLIWLFIAATRNLSALSYAACATPTSIFDMLLLGLTTSIRSKFNFATVEFGFRLLKFLLCICMILVALASLFQKSAKLCDEAEPLIPRAETSSVDKEDEDVDGDGQNMKWNKEFRQRLTNDSGSWLPYIKAFKIFIPFLVPKNDRKVQASLMAFVFCLVAERGLNLLIPRQLGIVTDQLAASVGGSTSASPFLALALYLILQEIPLRQIQSIVELPLTMFSYKQILMAAYHHLMTLDAGFHDNEDSSELYMAVHQGSSVQDLLMIVIRDVIPALADMVIAFWYLGYLFGFYISYTCFVAAVCFVFCHFKFTRWTQSTRRQLIKTYKAEYQCVHRSISNWRNVWYFNRLDYESSRLSTAIDDAQAASRKDALYWYITDAIEDIIIAMALAVVASLVVLLIYNHKAPVGNFIVLITYWSGLWAPIQQMSRNYSRLNRRLLEAERLLWLFLTKPTIFDSPNAKDLELTNATVGFRNIDFSYDSRKTVLEDITFDAPGGTTTALVGETGGGKSTIFKLLQRFHDPKGGCVEIDGQDVRNVTLTSLREAIGVVPQDPHLFNVSIMENVRYGRLDASDEQVYDACRAASIHEKIMSFPDQYASVVGERGVKLSGGELQRVAIARCLLKDPRILLLDEASSAVDSETEVKIQNALSKLTVGRTTFAIAHRLSTIAKADRILVIHGGKIVESGTHEELLRLGTRYHELWTMQVANALNVDKTKLENGNAFDFSTDTLPQAISDQALIPDIAESRIADDNSMSDLPANDTKGKIDYSLDSAKASDEPDTVVQGSDTIKQEAKPRARNKHQRRKQSRSDQAPAQPEDDPGSSSAATHTDQAAESSEQSKMDDEGAIASETRQSGRTRRGSTWGGRGSRGRGGWSGKSRKAQSESQTHAPSRLTKQTTDEDFVHPSDENDAGPSKSGTSGANDESKDHNTA